MHMHCDYDHCTLQGSATFMSFVAPQQTQDGMQSGSQRYGKEDRWQLPGLTVSDAFKPEDWQSFCTKVDVQQPSESSKFELSTCPDIPKVIHITIMTVFGHCTGSPTDSDLSSVC